MTEPRFINGFVDGSDLVLLYRDEVGVLKARRRRAEWSSFHRARDLAARPDVLRDLRGSEFVLGISEEGEWTRVKWQAPEWRAKACGPEGWFETRIKHFEADVHAIRRFFSDTGAQVAKPRRIGLDIETDSRVPPAQARQGKARVLIWSLVDDSERVVARGCLEHETDEDERRLLEELWRALDPYDQVVSWFGDGFDFPIVKGRSEIVGAAYKDSRRWLWCDFMPVYERMNRNAAESGDEKESLSLHAVCMARLGEGKNEFDASKTYEAWAEGGAARQRLIDYCDQDTKLLPKLWKKTGFLDINDAICEVARSFADTRSADPTSFVDGFMLRMAVERGTHFPSRAHYGREEQEQHEKFAGAYVMAPKLKGIERDLHVCDFSGMYPSIDPDLEHVPRDEALGERERADPGWVLPEPVDPPGVRGRPHRDVAGRAETDPRDAEVLAEEAGIPAPGHPRVGRGGSHVDRLQSDRQLVLRGRGVAALAVLRPGDRRVGHPEWRVVDPEDDPRRGGTGDGGGLHGHRFWCSCGA